MRVGKILFEFENVANVGAAPGVDALVLVAHRAHILVLAGQQLHQLVLRAVGVLVLVDQQIAIAALVALAHFARNLEQAHGLQQQIVEVQRVVLAQLVLVGLEDVGDALAVGILRAEEILLRIDHVVLGPGDAAQHRARRELLGVEPHALHDLLHDALLIVLVEDRKRARQALVADLQRFDVAAQNAHAQRVEGGDQRLGERRVAQQLFDALGHLAGGLVGEGDGQDRVGRDVFLADEPGDAVVMTRVLPEPAPARISSGPSVASTAARCSGLRLSRSGCKASSPAGRFLRLV